MNEMSPCVALWKLGGQGPLAGTDVCCFPGKECGPEGAWPTVSQSCHTLPTSLLTCHQSCIATDHHNTLMGQCDLGQL